MRGTSVDIAIDSYVPTSIGSTEWGLIADAARRITRSSAPTTGTSASHRILAITQVLLWASRLGLPLDVEDLFTPEVIERYIATGCPNLSPASRGTRRSVLRTVGRRVTRRARWDSPAPVYPTARPYQPYTARECDWLIECARSQATVGRRRVMTVLLGLGLGAGLAPDEIADLTARRIITVTPDRYAVALEQRIVPIRTAYAPLIVDLAARLPADAPLIRDKAVPRIETLWSLLQPCEVPVPLQPLTVSRLRTTWAHDALASPIPLPHVVGAYGLRSAAFIEPLMPALLASIDPESVVANSALYEF